MIPSRQSATSLFWFFYGLNRFEVEQKVQVTFYCYSKDCCLFIRLWDQKRNGWNHLIRTSGFATTHVVVTVRHPITYWSPHHLPTSQIRWKFILERIKLTARIASIHAIFQLKTVRRIRIFFSLKHSASQGESSLKILARWGLPFQRS